MSRSGARGSRAARGARQCDAVARDARPCAERPLSVAEAAAARNRAGPRARRGHRAEPRRDGPRGGSARRSRRRSRPGSRAASNRWCSSTGADSRCRSCAVVVRLAGGLSPVQRATHRPSGDGGPPLPSLRSSRAPRARLSRVRQCRPGAARARHAAARARARRAISRRPHRAHRSRQHAAQGGFRRRARACARGRRRHSRRHADARERPRFPAADRWSASSAPTMRSTAATSERRNGSRRCCSRWPGARDGPILPAK